MKISTPATCFPKKSPYLCRTIQHNGSCVEPPARVAQLVERDLAKVEVASSNLVSRSKIKKTLSSGSVFCFQRFVMGATRKCLSIGEEFRLAVAESLSVRQVLVRIGLVPAGGNYKTGHARIAKLKLDTSHFTGAGWNVGARYRMLVKPFSWDGILIENSLCTSTNRLRNQLIEHELKYNKCERCGLKKWLERPIPLELHHINGVNNDNRLPNLQSLYPNCHALTESYRGKNQARAKG